MTERRKRTTAEAIRAVTGPAEPVSGFGLRYVWHTGPWQRIFDRQIELISNDVARAQAEGRLVVYLSCPISSRGGGYSGTNVDIARFVERRLLQQWGEGVWILNPAQYQLESKAGTGLMNQHAQAVGLDIDRMKQVEPPFGGDYMRMWTKVLVESKKTDEFPENQGQHFDAFYFIGPRDVQAFFTEAGDTLTAGIHEYFARKFTMDHDFLLDFSVPEVDGGHGKPTPKGEDPKAHFQQLRRRFFRYYALRAGVAFSLGSHDEWAIFQLVNKRRLEYTTRADGPAAARLPSGNCAELLAGFYDGVQLCPGAAEAPASLGYAYPSVASSGGKTVS